MNQNIGVSKLVNLLGRKDDQYFVKYVDIFFNKVDFSPKSLIFGQKSLYFDDFHRIAPIHKIKKSKKIKKSIFGIHE